MSLLALVLTLIVVGVLLYLVNSVPFIDGKIKSILNWVVIAVLIVWLLRVFGFWGYLSNIRL